MDLLMDLEDSLNYTQLANTLIFIAGYIENTTMFQDLNSSVIGLENFAENVFGNIEDQIDDKN